MYQAYKQLQAGMAGKLIQQEPLLVRKEALKDVDVVAGIDRGSTLTKMLYASEEGDDHYRLHFAVFDNRHFDEALEFLGKQSLLVRRSEQREKAKLRVTGTGGSTHGERIRTELGFLTEFIDEALTQFAGFHFLVSNFSDTEICHEPPRVKEYDIQRSELIKELLDKQAKEMQQAEDEKFPCLYCIFGSSAGIALVHKDGRIEVKHRHLLAGKSFLGACQLLLGTSRYSEVMEMASAGNRGNIDSQARDFLVDDPEGPYGRLPPSMCVFSFGKAVDYGKTLEETKPEDMAHSLVSCFVSNFYMAVTYVARKCKVQRVYFGGNFCQHEIVRSEFLEQVQFHGNQDKMHLRFLKTGHTGAIGAMLSNEEDVKEFFATMRVRPRAS